MKITIQIPFMLLLNGYYKNLKISAKQLSVKFGNHFFIPRIKINIIIIT